VTALTKVSPEEGLAYKKWVLAIGMKVAEAAKENGVAVSDPEKAALSEISTALGVGGQ
jgi:uroporphyrinogen-III synthase